MAVFCVYVLANYFLKMSSVSNLVHIFILWVFCLETHLWINDLYEGNDPFFKVKRFHKQKICSCFN